jgi:hypothetical protein
VSCCLSPCCLRVFICLFPWCFSYVPLSVSPQISRALPLLAFYLFPSTVVVGSALIHRWVLEFYFPEANLESREQESQLKNLIEDRNRKVRESRDQETILNGLVIKTLDEVGHLKNLLDNKNLELRESREQEKILKGLLDKRDAADVVSQNKSVRLET